jgi:hypothetical protein
MQGVAILCAVLVVVTVSAVNDYQKEQQFRALSAVKDDVQVCTLLSLQHEYNPSVLCFRTNRQYVYGAGPSFCPDYDWIYRRRSVQAFLAGVQEGVHVWMTRSDGNILAVKCP